MLSNAISVDQKTFSREVVTVGRKQTIEKVSLVKKNY
jgi:hypothetical protein